MHEQHITLADIRHEAAQLEFNLDISTGHLDIYQRASSSSSFYSTLAFDDPRALVEAWTFLQERRTFLDQVDEARCKSGNHLPQCRTRKVFAVLYHLLVLVLASGAGALVAVIVNVLLALIVFSIIFAAGALLRSCLLH